MARALPPFWLAKPGRYAGIGRVAAVRIALVLGLLVACAMTALIHSTNSVDVATAATDVSDIALYQGIIAGLGAGGDYYQVAAEALRAGSYPLRPFVTFRLPVHAVVQATLPPMATLALLHALVAGVIAAWWHRLSPALSRTPARIAMLILLAGGLPAFVQPALVAFHEVWAALLIALALALWRPGRWLMPVALTLVAMLVRETSALFAIVMLGLAWRDGQRREAGGWVIALGVFGLALVAHAWAVAQVVNPLDPSSPGWSGMMGPGFFVWATVQATALAALPLALAAPLVALALFGWSVWRDPAAERAGATFLGYGAAIALFARADTFYWALMVAPMLLVGLVFVPDGLRDLWRGLLDRPRVRVQRVSQ